LREKVNEADYSLCRRRRRNSGLVVEKRYAQAQGLIPALRRGNLVIERSSTIVLILTSRTDASRRAWMGFARPTHCETAGTKGLEKRYVKISTDRGRCGLVAWRNFPCDGKNPRGPRTALVPHLGINETTSRPTVPDPYYRLPDSYYGYSDPLQGLFDFYAVPPFSPGYTYRHVRPAR
jgi:hypothetical protein